MKLSTLLARLAEGTASAEEQLATSVWMQQAHAFAKEAEGMLARRQITAMISIGALEAQEMQRAADDLASDYVEMGEGDRAPFFGSEGGAA